MDTHGYSFNILGFGDISGIGRIYVAKFVADWNALA